jgi:DNA-binding helix-hairpin-helix protein with protein kinase domain
MPYVDHDETYSLDNFFDPVLSKRLKPFESALTLRIQLAINLCELIENLHKNKNYFIDIKPQNIRVYKKNHKVILLDCDGYSINNFNESPSRFDAELISTDYIAPEVTRDNLKINTLGLQQDLYGLAVILFQLLNRGTHPFQGITIDKNISASTNDERASLGLYAYGLNGNWKVKPRPQSIHNLFLTETRELFDKSFETDSRITAAEWSKHFKEILVNKKLELCQKVDRSRKLQKDLIHMKFYGKECIGCKLELEQPSVIKNKKSYESKILLHVSKSSSKKLTSQKSFSVKNASIKKPEDFNFVKFLEYAVAIIAIIVLMVECSGENNKSKDAKNNTYTYPKDIKS